MGAVLRRVGIYVLCTLLAAPLGMALFGALLIHPNATDPESLPTAWVVLTSALWLTGLGLVVWNPARPDTSGDRPPRL